MNTQFLPWLLACWGFLISSSGAKLMIYIFSENYQFQLVFNWIYMWSSMVSSTDSIFPVSVAASHFLMFSFIYLAIRLSRLKKSSHDRSSPRPYELPEPMHYVHSPEIEELEPGTRVRKVAREGQPDKHKSFIKHGKGQRACSWVPGLEPLHLLSSSPHPVQRQLPPCLQHPAGTSFPTSPDFPGESWHLSSDVPGYFFV